MQTRGAKHIEDLAAARQLVLEQRRHDRTDRKVMADVLDRMGEHPDDASELDRADDALNGWIHTVGAHRLVQVLKRVEGNCLYTCIGAPVAEELEHIFQLNQLSDLVYQIGVATDAHEALVAKGKRPTVALRQSRDYAELRLMDHFEFVGYEVVVRGLRRAEKRLMYFREVDVNQEVWADLLLLRELTDRIEEVGRCYMHGVGRRKSKASKVVSAAQAN